MAQSVKIYNWTGKEVGTVSLPAALFAVPVKAELVQQAVVAQQSQARNNVAHTKGRGDVRGGGKKPWKQKGTGRARHGSIRSPLWVGGGVTFGPTKERNFVKKLSKQMKKKALAMVLTDKAAHDRVVILEDSSLAEAKTKVLASHLKSLPGSGRSRVIITTKGDTSLIRAAQNLPKVSTLGAASLNILDLLRSDYIYLPQNLIQDITKRYS
mgnify:FL=1